MLFSFQDCLEKYGTAYRVSRAVADGGLHKMEAGVYSDTGAEDELDIIQFKYPKAILTLESAYFYYDMTDSIPDCYHMATGMHAAKIIDDRVRQYFIAEEILNVGVVEIEHAGSRIRTYDLERLMIETVRMKRKLPSDIYKEIVIAFRSKMDSLYPAKIGEYLSQHPFPKKAMIERMIYEEIF